MALFEQTVQINVGDVSDLIHLHFDLILGTLIKASQNSTFNATSNMSGTKYIVRVTPITNDKIVARIENEMLFLDYIKQFPEVYHLCNPIQSKSGNYIVKNENIIIVVTEYAIGKPIDFLSYEWMTNQSIVKAWGKWLSNFHQISRKFVQLYPNKLYEIQKWDEIHHGILANSCIHTDDINVMSNIEHYGILHGDLNCSNFYYDEVSNNLSVFDWDQTQVGWYLWDVAQACFTVHMLHGAGSVVDGSKVELANPKQFEDWLVEGYESISGKGSVDRLRLERMIILRKSFYERFCRKAKEQGEIPKDMAHFINYIVNWFDKEKENVQI